MIVMASISNAELKSTRVAYSEALVELGATYPDLFVVDADLSASTLTNKFAERYPERFINVGCAEQNLIGTAAGLAAGGKIVFASTFAIFATTKALEQIRNTVAHDKLNVKIAATHSGLTNAPDGASHQSLEDLAVMRTIPNMTVVVPADYVETQAIVKDLVKRQGPTYVRLNRIETPVIYDTDYKFKFGKADILKDGADVALIGTGTMVAKILSAEEQLAKEKISASALNISTLKPLDTATILHVARSTGAIVTVEEHSIYGGLGGAVAEIVCEHYPVPVKRVGVKDRMGQSGTYPELIKEYGLDVPDIIDAVHEVLSKR